MAKFGEIFKDTDAKKPEPHPQRITKWIHYTKLIDNKAQYNGMEIMGAINRFNRNLHWEKGLITVPAIKNSPDDTFASPIGDEFDFFDFMTDKSSDQIIKDLKDLDDSLDGVGNKKAIEKL